MTVLVPNVVSGTPPLHAARTRLEMVYDGGRRRAYANGPAELLALLIAGYGGSEQQRLQQRVEHALHAQVRAQARFVAQDWQAYQAATSQQRRALHAPRHNPVAVRVWDCPIPLVVVDVLFEPFTPGVPLPLTPDGDVAVSHWLRVLRPTDEWDYLESLAHAEVIRLATLISAVS